MLTPKKNFLNPNTPHYMKLQITKGLWKSQQQTNGDIYISTNNWFNFLKVMFVHNANTKEHREQCLYNSKLICDAGNTYQQCGLTPSELLEQNKQMKEALQIAFTEIRSMKLCLMSHPDHIRDSEFWDRTDGAEEVEKVITDLLTQIQNQNGE